MNRLELGTGVALAGAAIFQVHSVYTQHAGPLTDVREAQPGNPATLQRLTDADCMAGGLTLLAGVAISVATGKWYALGLAVVAFGLVAAYYHLTANGPAVAAGEDTEE